MLLFIIGVVILGFAFFTYSALQIAIGASFLLNVMCFVVPFIIFCWIWDTLRKRREEREGK